MVAGVAVVVAVAVAVAAVAKAVAEFVEVPGLGHVSIRFYAHRGAVVG